MRPKDCAQGWHSWHGTFELKREFGRRDAAIQVAPGVIYSHSGKVREFGVGIPIGLRGDAARWGILGKITLELASGR